MLCTSCITLCTFGVRIFLILKKKDQISFASPSFLLLIIHYRRCIITREGRCNADSYLEDNIIFNHNYFFHVLLHALFALQFLTLDILTLEKKTKKLIPRLFCVFCTIRSKHILLRLSYSLTLMRIWHHSTIKKLNFKNTVLSFVPCY